EVAAGAAAVEVSGGAEPAAPDVTLLDVRTRAEHEAGALPGSLHVHIGQVMKRLDELPRGGKLVVYCQSGGRAAAVVSALRARGFGNVIELAGGYEAWRS